MKSNKIHLGTVTHGFHPRTVLIVAKDQSRPWISSPDDRQVVVWSGTPEFERIVWVPLQAHGIRAAHEGPLRNLALIHPNNLTMETPNRGWPSG